jgi:hypothetical protein
VMFCAPDRKAMSDDQTMMTHVAQQRVCGPLTPTLAFLSAQHDHVRARGLDITPPNGDTSTPAGCPLRYPQNTAM